MRVRILDGEVAAAFMGLARLRPDVVLAPAPADGGGHGVYDVGLIGSYDSAERKAQVATLVGAITCQLHRRFSDVAVEVVS